MKKTNWPAVGVVVVVLLAWIGWENSQEKRIADFHTAADLSERVQNLENLLVPLLVEFKVQQALAERAPEPPVVEPIPIEPDVHIPPREQPAAVREEAEKWANERIKQYKR